MSQFPVAPRPAGLAATRATGRAAACSPIQYARRYHNLLVRDGRQKLCESVNITRYQNGVRDHTTAERDAIFAMLKKLLKVGDLPGVFRFPVGDVMDPGEAFYKKGLERAYNGKGSPVEIEEALRIAYRFGRIGPKTKYRTMSDYGRQFFGLDCNGFVGNYWGLSPGLSIGVWALGEPGKLLDWDSRKQRKYGWGRAELLSAPFIPLTPRQSAAEARTGDILITVLADSHYKHIATVDRVLPLGADLVTWTIVEWGSEGGESSHIRDAKTVKLVRGPNKKFGVGFQSKDKFRYLFAGPDTPFLPATWGRCGMDDA